jgi:hypothetical protein
VNYQSYLTRIFKPENKFHPQDLLVRLREHLVVDIQHVSLENQHEFDKNTKKAKIMREK